jgi:CubicO group peptidase (beta-lactamase class C family)
MSTRRFPFCFAVILAALAEQACSTAAPAPLPSFKFRQEKLAEMAAATEQAVAAHQTPGAVLWLEHGGVAYHKAFGERAIEPVVEGMTERTIFDAASLTKVIATTPAVMLLMERGALDVDAPVQKYIQEFRRDGKEAITVRHLLTHTSGLRPGLSRKPNGWQSTIAIACQEQVTNAPGSRFIYSDINFILLGEIVQRVSSRPLEKFVTEEIYRPLKMNDTRYRPWSVDRHRIAPTERDGTNILRGIVHDPTARKMDGVAGHAGVFTTAADLARFARMMLNYGEIDGVRLFRPETIAAMTSIQSPAMVPARRGFGWDIDSGYSRPRGNVFPIGSYGHTGFTGTAIWIDPFSNTFWILLTNRVHPDGKGNILSLQRTLGTLAAEAAGLRVSASASTNAVVRRPESTAGTVANSEMLTQRGTPRFSPIE